MPQLLPGEVAVDELVGVPGLGADVVGVEVGEVRDGELLFKKLKIFHLQFPQLQAHHRHHLVHRRLIETAAGGIRRPFSDTYVHTTHINCMQ